jgi:hypothetical protein
MAFFMDNSKIRPDVSAIVLMLKEIDNITVFGSIVYR